MIGPRAVENPGAVKAYTRYEDVLADDSVDAVLGVKWLEFDVYKAMDVAAPSILAADSIAQGSKPMRVPDFRPSASRAKGQAPKQARG